MIKKLAAVTAAAVCLGLGGFGIPPASAMSITSGAGPYYPQGTVVDLCIGTAANTLDHVYAEAGPDAGELGTCGTGYTQLPTISDPAGYPFPVPGATSATDVVTVNPVSPDPFDATTGTAFSYQMAAASSKGYEISTWSLSGEPTGVTITSMGLIQGSSSVAAGTYDITVTAVDTNGVAGSVEFELDVS